MEPLKNVLKHVDMAVSSLGQQIGGSNYEDRHDLRAVMRAIMGKLMALQYELELALVAAESGTAQMLQEREGA